MGREEGRTGDAIARFLEVDAIGELLCCDIAAVVEVRC